MKTKLKTTNNLNKQLEFDIDSLFKNKKYNEALVKCLKFERDNNANSKIYNFIGFIYYFYQKYDLAINYFIKSLKIKPSYDAYINLANINFENQNHIKSFHYYQLAYREDCNKTLNNSNFIYYLKKIRFSEYSNEIESIYLKILNKKNFVRPRDFMNSILSLLTLKIEFKNIQNDFYNNNFSKDIILKLSKENLFIKLLETVPISDLFLEKFIVSLRKFLLIEKETIILNDSSKKVIEALSLQCINTDYIYNIDEYEKRVLKDLNSKKICDKLNSNKLNISIALLSCYVPLFEKLWIKKTNFRNVFKKIYKAQISNFEEEKIISKNITNFSSIRNETSKIVRKNYENLPYPRWTNLSLFTQKYKNIKEFCFQNDLKIKFLPENKKKKIKILVAGCGTGQDALEISSHFYNSEITAIDLSKKSLAYAIRNKKELKIKNVNFLQGDLLDTPKLNIMFDVIHCHGVLNHISNPYMGLKNLTRCLKEKGLIFLSLYSKIGRRDILDLRAHFLNKYKIIDNDILKIIRLEILENKSLQKSTYLNSVEFFNKNEFNDLLLHPQEHCFTLEEIENFILKLNYRFCGFLGLQNEKNKFKNLYGGNEELLNLKLWNEFENYNTKTFPGMYHFCLQKM